MLLDIKKEYYGYLEYDSFRGWNGLEHVAGDELQIVVTWPTA
jgi:hypothetical protein